MMVASILSGLFLFAAFATLLISASGGVSPATILSLFVIGALFGIWSGVLRIADLLAARDRADLLRQAAANECEAKRGSPTQPRKTARFTVPDPSDSLPPTPIPTAAGDYREALDGFERAYGGDETPAPMAAPQVPVATPPGWKPPASMR